MEGAFFLTNWLFLGMRWLHTNVTNEHIVLTIVIATLVIRGLSVPGDIKSRRSNMKMQAIQPEINKLQKKYKDNPQKLQQAQSKLMRDSGTSMFGGCLPMLIMMPLFFAFIAAFRYWGYEMQIKMLLEMDATGTSALWEQFRFLWVTNIWQPDAGHQPVIMSAQQFLAIKELPNLMYFKENPAAFAAFERLGFVISDPANIPQASIDTYNSLVAPILKQYEGYNNGWYLLPLLAGGTTFISTWIMQKNQPKPDPNAPGANSTKMMQYVMPIMSVVFCLSANAAFAVYWTISNIATLGTNLLLNRKFEKERLAAEEGNKNE